MTSPNRQQSRPEGNRAAGDASQAGNPIVVTLRARLAIDLSGLDGHQVTREIQRVADDARCGAAITIRVPAGLLPPQMALDYLRTQGRHGSVLFDVDDTATGEQWIRAAEGLSDPWAVV